MTSALCVRADARDLPLPDASVDLIVTSPPYFALRSYQDGGEHYDGQVGAEPSPQAFLESLWECTAEWLRVLKSSGSLWVNLGDKYSGAQAQNIAGANRAGNSARTWQQTDPRRTGIPNKSLMGLPWRYALGCIDDLGLILRAEVIWSKPNGLPESVTDRVRRSHEHWFHFTQFPRYFSAVDEVREAHAPRTIEQAAIDARAGLLRRSGHRNASVEGYRERSCTPPPNPLGKLPGSVWTVPTEPLRVPDHLGVDHFAAFPTEFPRRIIQGWSPAGVCVACGEGRRPVVDRKPVPASVKYVIGRNPTQHRDVSRNDQAMTASGPEMNRWRAANPETITGYSCACPDTTAPTTPAVVLDPFGGTGTTALVASTLGRIGISVDLSHDYSRLACWRTRDPGERARAMRIDKPPVQVSGQGDLFGATA